MLGKWIFVFVWPLFLFGAGGWLLRQKEMPEIDELMRTDHSYIVELKSVPINKGSYYYAEAEILYAPDSVAQCVVGHNLLLNIYADSLPFLPRLCDRYLINTKIIRQNAGGIDGFNYGKYLARNGLCGVAYLYGNNIKYLSTEQPSGFIQRSYLLRDKLIRQFESIGLKGSQLAIISAITLGEKGLLSDDVRDTFSAAGVSHILVVSGMHVGFIFLIVMWFMRRASYRRRWLVVAVGLIILWGYALLTGLAPSVVRATFMFSMMLLFRVLGEKYRVKSALCLSATILIIINPNVLFNVGFQLSYLAVAGIVYFYPLLHKRISTLKYRPLRWIFSSIAVTISAQILTMPIVIYNFNQFPIYFILSNLFVTAFAPLLFLGGIALLPLSYIPYLGVSVGWIMNYIIMDLEWNNAYCKKKKGFMNEIIEIGAVKLDEELNQIDTFSLFIKAQLGKKLHTRVKELTNISNDDISTGTPFSQAMSEFRKWSAGENNVVLTWGDTDVRVLVENFRYFNGINFVPFL